MGRCRQGKKLLLGSLACWILFTIPLSFIKPEPVNCIERNATGFVLTYTRAKRDLSAFDMADISEDSVENDYNESVVLAANTNLAIDASEESHSR